MKYFRFSDGHVFQGDQEELHPSQQWCHPENKKTT